MTAFGKRHLFLSGFSGTGKTAVGCALAQHLGRPYFDTDSMIETIRHKSIPDIFADDGEPVFRLSESKAIRLCLGAPAAVIALGGGALMTPTNVKLIKQTGYVVLLTAEWPTIWERLQGEQQRPVLVTNDHPGTLEEFVKLAQPILDQRMETYDRVSDFVVDTSSKSVSDVVSEIDRWAQRNVNAHG